jgi:hypothetical protein
VSFHLSGEGPSMKDSSLASLSLSAREGASGCIDKSVSTVPCYLGT